MPIFYWIVRMEHAGQIEADDHADAKQKLKEEFYQRDGIKIIDEEIVVVHDMYDVEMKEGDRVYDPQAKETYTIVSAYRTQDWFNMVDEDAEVIEVVTSKGDKFRMLACEVEFMPREVTSSIRKDAL